MMFENTYVHNYMNEHAKSIWKAWADGKLVQTHQSENGEWRTLEPIQVMPEMMPHKVPDRWRIKPKTKTKRFRVYFDLEDKKPRIVYFSEHKETIERPFYFGGWLSDELTYEVEVEE